MEEYSSVNQLVKNFERMFSKESNESKVDEKSQNIENKNDDILSFQMLKLNKTSKEFNSNYYRT